MKRVAGFLLLAASLATAGPTLEGTWSISRDPARKDRVQVDLKRGRSHHLGTLLPLDALTGLSPAKMDAATVTSVHFALRREAGDTAFQGSFRRGKGSGGFAFTPRPAFLEQVQALGVGVGSPHPDELLFALAMHDVTVAYIRGMIAEGYRLDLDDYPALRIFDVTPEYVRAMEAVGFARLSHDELLASRIHGVTPEYVKAMRAQGWNFSFDAYLAGRIHGVTPAFAQQMRKLGYADLSQDDLLAFRIHGVTGEFILDLRDLGYGQLDADDLIAARIHGVTPQFIHQVERAGYKGLPFAQLLDLRIHGISEGMRVN